MVEDVDVVGAEVAQTVVERGQDRLAGAAFEIRARTDRVACLGRQDEFVPVRREVLGEHGAEVLLGCAMRRAVAVGVVEVGDAQVERVQDDLPLRLETVVATELLPQAEREGGQIESGISGAAIRDLLVAVFGSGVGEVEGAVSSSGQLTIIAATQRWVGSP